MPFKQLPDPLALFLKSGLIGFAIAAVFTGLVLGLDVAGIGGLVARSDIGIMATVVFWVLNGIVFSGVQFGLFVMAMADDDDDGPSGGHGQHVLRPIPVRRDR